MLAARFPFLLLLQSYTRVCELLAAHSIIASHNCNHHPAAAPLGVLSPGGQGSVLHPLPIPTLEKGVKVKKQKRAIFGFSLCECGLERV
uniref:Putative secreted protein n=1 Tax=Anopheles marajoara TaxID=58244 RepID=A0A2M4CA04_9DIPT